MSMWVAAGDWHHFGFAERLAPSLPRLLLVVAAIITIITIAVLSSPLGEFARGLLQFDAVSWLILLTLVVLADAARFASNRWSTPKWWQATALALAIGAITGLGWVWYESWNALIYWRYFLPTTVAMVLASAVTLIHAEELARSLVTKEQA